jgi:hypothetical protein
MWCTVEVVAAIIRCYFANLARSVGNWKVARTATHLLHCDERCQQSGRIHSNEIRDI